MKIFNLYTSYDANRAVNNKGRSSCTQGFTLVELLVVITIITIMVSVGAIVSFIQPKNCKALNPGAQQMDAPAESDAVTADQPVDVEQGHDV